MPFSLATTRFSRSETRNRREDMDHEHRMIPMGKEDEVEAIPMGDDDETEVEVAGPGAPPTVKQRNAVQQEVGRLLDALAPERAAHRTGLQAAEVERHRTPRGCILQARSGAVSVSWFADSAQGAELGELQVVAWRGVVSRPGSSQRAAGATIVEELVLRPGERGMQGLNWRSTDGTNYSTDSLVEHCLALLQQFTDAGPSAGTDA
jgi:hypothetical protein